MKTASINRGYLQQHNLRFEGEHYLNDNAYLSMHMETHCDKCKHLDELALVFNPPVFKRQFCNKTPRSVQYFQSSDVNNASEESSVHIFKGQAESLNLLVKHNDILVTGFGSIGNTRLVSILQDGVCYANNVCRVRTNAGIKAGYLYACMSSKYSTAQLNNNASGSVVRYIEAPGIKKTLIPNFPESFQQQVDNLIQESARLREDATIALNSAKEELSSYIKPKFNKVYFKTTSVKASDIWSSLQQRLDPPAIMNDGVISMQEVTSRFPYSTIANINAKVYRPGIFKRNYVQHGIPYIKGSEIFLTNPFRRCEMLSRTLTPFIDQMSLREGQILITCAGSVGDIKLITKEYEDKQSIGSQDIIRLESNDDLYTKEYLFTYLQLPFVYDYIQSMKYGSVIERIEPFHVESIPVVAPTKEISKQITELIQRYMESTYKAFIAEEKAIMMVEQEIEKWNN